MSRKILKNFSSLIMAQLIYKLCTFVMMILIARFLRPDAFGRLSYGLSFVWAFLFLSDFGLSELFIRDVSRERQLQGKYVNNIITLKILIGLISYLVIILTAWRLSVDIEKSWIIMILGASVILDSFMYFFRCLFRVKETMEYEGLLMIIEALLKLGVILLAIKSEINISRVILISFALLVVSILNFIVNLISFCLKNKTFSFSIDKVFWPYLLKTGFPFAFVYILSLLNFRIDIIMLSLMKGDEAAGWYSANYKLLEQLILIPITLSAVYLPVFSRLSDTFGKLHTIFIRTVPFLLLLGISLIAIINFFKIDIIRIVYGKEFESASQYIFILSWVLIPYFFKPIVEKLLYALGKQATLCFIYSSGILGNIILNIILIPRWGINGASFATFIFETLIVLSCIILYLRFYKIYSVQYKIERTLTESEIF